MTAPDFVVWTDNGSLWLVRPETTAARERLDEIAAGNAEAQWWVSALVVEHRYIGGLIDGLTSEGYRVRVE